jgi:hypothetical protein
MRHPAPVIFGHAYRLFDIGGVIGAIGLVAAAAMTAARNTRRLYREERLTPD